MVYCLWNLRPRRCHRGKGRNHDFDPVMSTLVLPSRLIFFSPPNAAKYAFFTTSCIACGHQFIFRQELVKQLIFRISCLKNRENGNGANTPGNGLDARAALITLGFPGSSRRKLPNGIFSASETASGLLLHILHETFLDRGGNFKYGPPVWPLSGGHRCHDPKSP